MSTWDCKSGLTDPYSQNNSSNVYQDIKLVLKTGPTQSIVSKAEAKNFLKMSSDTTDDDLVENLISASTAVIERELGGIALYHQTWMQYQQGGVETIELMRQPLIGTPTVSYYEDFSTVTATTLTASTVRAIESELYHEDRFFIEGRQGNGYSIEYDVGMFTASSYTSSNDPRLGTLKTALFRTIAWLYEQREEGVTAISEGNWSVSYDTSNVPVGIKRLVMPLHSGKGII